LCTFNNYAANGEDKIDTVSAMFMCQCITFASLSSVIPEHLKPSDDDVMRLIVESSQREEPAEIMLDIDANESLCCQHFIEFMENYVLPGFIRSKNNVPHMSDEEYNKKRKEVEETLRDYVENLNSTNCQSLFSDNSWILELRKQIQQGDPVQIEIAEKRIKTSVAFWVYELEKCLNGDNFDFSDHQEAPV
jgi:hypothetical protein